MYTNVLHPIVKKTRFCIKPTINQNVSNVPVVNFSSLILPMYSERRNIYYSRETLSFLLKIFNSV